MKKFLIDRILLISIISLIVFISLFYMNTLLPFFIGVFIAYLLSPIIKFFDRKKVNRNISSLIVLVAFFLFIYVFILLVIPIIAEQTIRFWKSFPAYLIKLNFKYQKYQF